MSLVMINRFVGISSSQSNGVPGECYWWLVLLVLLVLSIVPMLKLKLLKCLQLEISKAQITSEILDTRF